VVEVTTGASIVTWSPALLESIVRLIESQSEKPVINIIGCDPLYIIGAHCGGRDGQLAVRWEPWKLGFDIVQLVL
jgi:hypothetical protein